MTDHIATWTKYAQDKLNDPDWHPWHFERVLGGILLTGARCPKKKDGTPNFRKRDKSTEIRVLYPIEE